MNHPDLEATLAHELSHAASYSLGLMRIDRLQQDAYKRELRIEEDAAEIISWLITAQWNQEDRLYCLKCYGIEAREAGVVGLERASKIYQFLTGNPLERTVVRNALRTLLSMNQQPKAVSYNESLFAKV